MISAQNTEQPIARCLAHSPHPQTGSLWMADPAVKQTGKFTSQTDPSMASVRTPRYLKIFDIQGMLKYIFLDEKRPHFIQLKKKPTSVVLVMIGSAAQQPVDSGLPVEAAQPHGPGKGASSDIHSSTMQKELSRLGIHTNIHINESFNLEYIFRNILRSTDIGSVDLDCITEESIEQIEKQDINHLFSYSTYIKTKTEFDHAIFDSFARPVRETGYFLVAVDCEMMDTMDGRQIGRLTMLDHTGRVLMDEYVKPSAPVFDFLEAYSGLTEANTGAGLDFDSLQKRLVEFIGTSTYVLGHGLENDLAALQFYTDRIIDTAYLFLNSEGYKVKLSQLSRKFFSESIQEGIHCSSEDALCCLKLLAYKIAQTRKFLDPSTELIDLNARVISTTDKGEALRRRTERTLVLLEVDEIQAGEFARREDLFTVFFFEQDGSKFVAF